MKLGSNNVKKMILSFYEKSSNGSGSPKSSKNSEKILNIHKYFFFFNIKVVLAL